VTELDTLRAQVAAIEALIAADSGMGYTPIGQMRMFRESQIRAALNAPATQEPETPLLGVPVPGNPHGPSQGREDRPAPNLTGRNTP
jgi:hypothetical protein